MSISSRALLFLLPRCMAVRHVAAEITTGGCLLSEKFIQRRPWASTTRTMCLQRRCQLPLVKTSQCSFCTKVGHIYVVCFVCQTALIFSFGRNQWINPMVSIILLVVNFRHLKCTIRVLCSFKSTQFRCANTG